MPTPAISRPPPSRPGPSRLASRGPASIATLAALVAVPLALAAGCAAKPSARTAALPPAGAAETTAPPAALPTVPAGVDETALDRRVAPCDDFYRFACGSWIAATPIPPEEREWARSFDVIRERNELLLRGLLERDAAGQGDGEAYAKQLGDVYAACMDEPAIEAAGTKPLEPIFSRIQRIATPADLAEVLGGLHAHGSGAAFAFGSGQDFRDATQVIGILEQAGLGLPDRDYYLSDDPRMASIRAAYEAHVTAMFALAGEPGPAAAADARTVLAMERVLAKASIPKEEERDPHKVYHRLDRAGLVKLAPDMPWDGYFAALGAPGVTAINVAEPGFVEAVDRLLLASVAAPCKAPPDPATGLCLDQPRKFHPDEWQAYLRFHLLREVASALPRRFVDESFRFERLLTGAQTLPPRWKRCVRATNGAMGQAVAQPFVKRILGPEGKAGAEAMIGNVEQAMRQDLEQLAWMDPETRARAEEKLSMVANQVAYPERWRSYDGLETARRDNLGNHLRAAAFEVRRELAKIGKPVDRTDWEMSPQTVNAYYDPTLNEMVFPAGILEAPFYANRAPLATNYGGIGMVMGHELTHGFDDEGRQFDGRGNLRDWWTPASAAAFEERAACVVRQFDSYVVEGDLHVNGRLTLGENLADLGGLRLSHAAFMKSLREGGAAIPGPFTPEQQFFLGFAQSWCAGVRPEYLRTLVRTNPHSPPRLRVDGPLSNLPEFAGAFSCPEGSPMVRKDRCAVW